MSFSIEIVVFGKKNHWITDDIERYTKLIKPFTSISFNWAKPRTVNEKIFGKAREPTNTTVNHNHIVGLSESGTAMTSIKFAHWVDTIRNRGNRLIFIIGDAYGIPQQIQDSCDENISLSKLTFPHKLALHILLEQVYRAFTILNHHPYHK